MRWVVFGLLAFTRVALADALSQTCFQLQFAPSSAAQEAQAAYQHCMDAAAASRKQLQKSMESRFHYPVDLSGVDDPCSVVSGNDRTDCETSKSLSVNRLQKMVNDAFQEIQHKLARATGDPSLASMPNNGSTMLLWAFLANLDRSAQSAIGSGAGTAFPFFNYYYLGALPLSTPSYSLEDAFLQYLQQTQQ